MKKTTIDVWVADTTFPGYMDRLWKLGETFGQAHPDYEIRIRGCDFRELPLEISRAAREGRPPAVAECYFYITQAARDFRAASGGPLFTSVEKAIGGRTEILGEPVVIDDIISAVRDYYTYDGDLTSMPSVATTSLLFCNMTLLRAAGVNRAPATWDELREACAAVAARRGGPDHAITWANHGTFFQQALAAQGGLLADHENGRAGRATSVDLASEAMLAWVDWWRELHRDGHYLYTGKIPDWQGTFKAFAEQQVAMRISSSNDVNYMLRAAEEAGFEVAVSRFPDNTGAPYEGNAVAGTSLWLLDGLDEPTRDGALAFLQFMHNPRNSAEQHKANSFVPITHASFALLEREGWFTANPFHRAASDQLKTFPGWAGPDRVIARGGVPESRGALFGDFAGVQDVMTRAMGDVLCHDAPPRERFLAATEEARLLVDDYETDRLGAPGPSRPISLRVEYFADAAPYSGADLENVVRLRR